jgi:hypothetical protein
MTRVERWAGKVATKILKEPKLQIPHKRVKAIIVEAAKKEFQWR